MKGQHSPWIAWSVTGSFPPLGFAGFTGLSRDIVATIASVWLHLRAATGRHGTTPGFHLLGMPRVHPRHTGGTTHLHYAVVFLLIIDPNKDAAANVVASFGPDGARNSNATAMGWTARMSETSVPTTNSG